MPRTLTDTIEAFVVVLIGEAIVCLAVGAFVFTVALWAQIAIGG